MATGSGQRKRSDQRDRASRRRGSRRSSRATLHPERLWKLFKRAGRLAKAVAVALLLAALLGLAYLIVPFEIVVRHPDPPPLELLVDCPPPVVSAFAGSGGLPNPIPGDAEMGTRHDQMCGALGRQRALTGLLLGGAGLLNAAALLEWARVHRRRKRRQRDARHTSRGSQAADATADEQISG